MNDHNFTRRASVSQPQFMGGLNAEGLAEGLNGIEVKKGGRTVKKRTGLGKILIPFDKLRNALSSLRSKKTQSHPVENLQVPRPLADKLPADEKAIKSLNQSSAGKDVTQSIDPSPVEDVIQSIDPSPVEEKPVQEPSLEKEDPYTYDRQKADEFLNEAKETVAGDFSDAPKSMVPVKKQFARLSDYIQKCKEPEKLKALGEDIEMLFNEVNFIHRSVERDVDSAVFTPDLKEAEASAGITQGDLANMEEEIAGLEESIRVTWINIQLIKGLELETSKYEDKFEGLKEEYERLSQEYQVKKEAYDTTVKPIKEKSADFEKVLSNCFDAAYCRIDIVEGTLGAEGMKADLLSAVETLHQTCFMPMETRFYEALTSRRPDATDAMKDKIENLTETVNMMGEKLKSTVPEKPEWLRKK